ncbi:polymorphic toxin type 46 domain-containing protein [Sphingomonas sp. ASY06-1R]|uniref:polymorphic toxin type 46 domain-containing protein n=1 Tax=Sphingomonas sp. ASY06-1R TaxID=3445771 RepID=UPI003FA25793
MGAAAAARVDDPFGHSSAMNGVVIGLAVGALIGAAILTGGVSLIAVGAAVAITGGAGMAGQAIGETIEGPETGVIKIGSRNVFINGRPAAMTVLATGPCSKDSGPPIPVATGAETVLINSQPAARVGEKMGCSAIIRKGSKNVFIGGPSKEVIKPTPEVPVALQNVMLAMTIGGTAIGTLGVGLTYGVGAAVGSLVGGAGGSYLGGQGATAAAGAMGYGATGQAVAGVLGSFAGGAIGGGLGFKGGQMRDVAVNRTTAQNYYAEQGWPQARIDSHLKGIDFTRPVKVVDLPAGTEMSQWQVPGGPKGNYFSGAQTKPAELGISPVGHDPAIGAVSKVQTDYVSTRPTSALRSTAAAVDDTWSSPYATAQTPGGGRQFFVPDQAAFSP